MCDMARRIGWNNPTLGRLRLWVMAAGASVTLCACGGGSGSGPGPGPVPVTTYLITTSGNDVTVTPSTPQSVKVGGTQAFTVTAASGYSLSSTVAGTCPQGQWVSGTYTTGAVTANCTVTFAATAITSVVTPTATNVSASPSTPQTVAFGATQAFTIVASQGFDASSTVGGTCPAGVWNGNVYTTGAISASCSVVFSGTAARNVLLQPFSSTSMWNTPIGSGAQLVAANLGTSSAPAVDPDDDIIILTPTAPLVDLYMNGAAWQTSTINRCDFTTWPITPYIPSGSSSIFSLPIPLNLTLPNESGTPNNSAAVLQADGQTLSNFQPIQICTAASAGGFVTFTNAFGGPDMWPTTNLYTDGIRGSHGGSGLSALGGTIRLGELVPGNSPIVHGVKDVMRHALKFEFMGLFNSFGTQVLPANNSDGANEGLLVALPQSFDYNSLQTPPARSIAWTLINYGAYLVDNPAWAAMGICVEKSATSVNATTFTAVADPYAPTDEFRTNWGYSFYQDGGNTPWLQDLEKIQASLSVVVNNEPVYDSHGNLIGMTAGGGTPLQPLLPPVTPP